MEKYPEPGTDSSVHATFRIISSDSNSSRVSGRKKTVGNSGMLEPFDLPGMVVAHQGSGKTLTVVPAASGKEASVFHLVSGLDGKPNSVSLESEDQKGCYVYSGVDYDTGASVTLNCISGSADMAFKQGTSFTSDKGISEYHPISFVAKGEKRNFLLQPLLSLRDESYTVYFNIHA